MLYVSENIVPTQIIGTNFFSLINNIYTYIYKFKVIYFHFDYPFKLFYYINTFFYF